MANFQAGNLQNCYSFWSKNCNDPSILSLIAGLRINPKTSVFQTKYPSPPKFSHAELNDIRSELQKMLKSNIIEPVHGRDEDEFISCIFVRPKPDGGAV